MKRLIILLNTLIAFNYLLNAQGLANEAENKAIELIANTKEAPKKWEYIDFERGLEGQNIWKIGEEFTFNEDDILKVGDREYKWNLRYEEPYNILMTIDSMLSFYVIIYYNENDEMRMQLTKSINKHIPAKSNLNGLNVIEDSYIFKLNKP